MTSDSALLLPLQGLPKPDNLAQLLGYPRRNPKVALYCELDKLAWKDSQACSNTADEYAWRLYTEHPRIRPFFQPYDWYDEEGPGPHFLLIDSETQRVSVGPMKAIDAAVGKPPPFEGKLNPVSQEDLDYILGNMRLSAPDVVATLESKRADRLAELKCWLRQLD